MRTEICNFSISTVSFGKALSKGVPVISVDTKKKELIGNYANKGRQWRETKTPEFANGHDFADASVPRAYPYGVYDLGRNTGFVNVGTDHDTGAKDRKDKLPNFLPIHAAGRRDNFR